MLSTFGEKGRKKNRCPSDNRLNIYTARTKTFPPLTSQKKKKNFKQSFSTPNYHLDSLTRREKCKRQKKKKQRVKKNKGGFLIRKINRRWIFKREGEKMANRKRCENLQVVGKSFSLGVVEKGELRVHLTERKKNF